VTQRTPFLLKNYYWICETDEKFNLLVAFLRKHKTSKHIVFFSTCASVEYFSCGLADLLKPMTLLSLHGKMKARRHKIFDSFRKLD
ncbi:ATP-dependent RNA helicase DDX55-like, partial [Saccoglossus kowalevskii]